MLMVGRKPGECISIAPAENTDTSMPVDALFSEGAIEIKLLRVSGKKVTIGVSAPDCLVIWRGSLVVDEQE